MEHDDSFKVRAEKWMKGLEDELEIGEHELDDLKDFVDTSLSDADSLSESNPAEAYSRVVKIANVAGHLARKKPALVDLLEHYVDKFISVMTKVKKALGAVSFTISVSFPFDLGISLTF